MSAKLINVTELLVDEIQQTPEEYHPLLLGIVRSFREGVTRLSAEGSFRQGWRDVMDNNTRSIDDLWQRMDTWCRWMLNIPRHSKPGIAGGLSPFFGVYCPKKCSGFSFLFCYS